MAYTLPTYTKAIDSAFVRTWYEIRQQAIDNILLATPVWAALKMKGCFKTQVGGTNIERTVRHTVGPTVRPVKKGTTLPSGEVDTKTAAFWNWRYVAAHVQRNLFDDQQNNGKFRIVSYVQDRITEARDALTQNFESSLFTAHDTAETADTMQGLNDLVPPLATVTTGSYGGITRASAYTTTNGTSIATSGNTFWGPKIVQGTEALEVNLRQDMTHLYNLLDQNQNEMPDLIVTTQDLFEAYEEFAVDSSQIIKDESTSMADLGFSVLRFKGKPLVWSPNMTAKNMLMLRTPYIDVVYDPQMWFDMTDWKQTEANGGDRIAHILCAINILSPQPRRHGRLYY